MRTCGAPHRQGPHGILLHLLQLLSGEKVLHIVTIYSHANPGLAWGDDEGVSPTTLEDLTLKPLKRARTRSPDSARRRTFRVKERIRARTEEYMRRLHTERDARRDARDRAFMEDIIAEMPEEHIGPDGE